MKEPLPLYESPNVHGPAGPWLELLDPPVVELLLDPPVIELLLDPPVLEPVPLDPVPEVELLAAEPGPLLDPPVIELPPTDPGLLPPETETEPLLPFEPGPVAPDAGPESPELEPGSFNDPASSDAWSVAVELEFVAPWLVPPPPVYTGLPELAPPSAEEKSWKPRMSAQPAAVTATEARVHKATLDGRSIKTSQPPKAPCLGPPARLRRLALTDRAVP